VTKDVIEPALSEIAAIRSRQDAGLISPQEEREAIRDVRDALDKELRVLREKNKLLFRGLGDQFRQNVQRLRALQGPAPAPYQPQANREFGGLQGAGLSNGASIEQRTPEVIRLNEQLLRLKRQLQQATLSQRIFRNAGVSAFRSIGAGVGRNLGQILTFQKKVASLGEVFQSVGSTIVSSLQKVVQQLTVAVAKAAALRAAIALVPGVGQIGGASSFSGLLGNVIPFAEGGIVTSPTLGLVGEAGPEAVVPLDKMNQMGGDVNVNGRLSVTMDELLFQMDRKLRSQGYSGLYN
jgi:hypothetical protein